MAGTENHEDHHQVMGQLRTFHCSGWSEENTFIFLTSHNDPVEIVSDSFPLNSNSSEIKCAFEVKALHGAKVVVTPVEVVMDGGCFDNTLTLEDDTLHLASPLEYPGLSAQCGQSDLPPSTHPISTPGQVRLTYTRTSNSGTVKFRIRLQASLPEVCPDDVTPDLCPQGPCCQGEGCCVVHAGVQPRGETNV